MLGAWDADSTFVGQHSQDFTLFGSLRRLSRMMTRPFATARLVLIVGGCGVVEGYGAR
jgi:hypothetical protein